MILGRGCLTLHIAMDHGTHRLVQAVVLLGLMHLLSAKLGRASTTSILLVHGHCVPENGAALTISSSHYHCLTRRSGKLCRSTSSTLSIVAAGCDNLLGSDTYLL